MDLERIIYLVGAVVCVPLILVGYIVGSDWLLRHLLRPRAQAAVRPWIWVGPALFLVGVFLVYPTIDTLRISFTDLHGQFNGVDNYQNVLGDSSVLIAIRNNLYWVVLYTVFVLGFGLLLAVLADRVPYEGPVKSLIFMPMAISFVAAGVIWSFMYDYKPVKQTGTLNVVVTNILHQQPVPWLTDRGVNNFALILVAVWIWTGFSMVILSAALKGISNELLEAARVDGANELQVFGRIIVPLLAPTLTVIGTTLVIFALKAFDIVYVMTGGNYETDVMANRMFKELFNVRNFGRASAIAVVLLLAVIPVLVFNVRRFRFQESIR